MSFWIGGHLDAERALQDAVRRGHALDGLRRRVGDALADTWRSAVTGTKLPGMSRSVNSPTYAAAIGAATVATDGTIMVRTTAPPWAQAMETGHGPIDMKPRLLQNARTARSGTPYQIIPFHVTDISTTPPVVRAALRRVPAAQKAGRRLGAGFEKPAPRKPKGMPAALWHAATGPRPRHLGVGRTTRRNPGFPNYTRKTGIFVHAYWQGTGGAGGTVTYRTVTGNSPAGAWVLPAAPPNPIREAVVQDVMRRLPSILP